MALRLAVTGAGGRMGRALTAAILSTTDLVLCAALEKSESSLIGQPLSKLLNTSSKLTISDDIDKALTHTDVLIDFTSPAATIQYVKVCEQLKVPMVIGTTGLTPLEKQALLQAAQQIGMVYSPNFSIGVNVMLKLLAASAHMLKDDYAVEIIEAHHQHKIDAPSGTALEMGKVIAEALGRDLDQCAVYDQQSLHRERDPQAIAFSSIRAGDIIGEHAVWFVGEAERIEIIHKAHNRQALVKGALRAACWIANHPVGLYSMQDVID
ncbi:MAG: 4-hydroxy-tetrahydrodipicolinate reductase [Neisseriales bacterium]|nr:MAG: 4-hydroxy-tetrahydrodipicolinate reductase [Neisseriales bacterium]